MRIVMMGTGGFAVPTFRSLVESRHEVVALVTRPTKAHTRRRGQLPRNPMREVAEQLGVADIRTPHSINDTASIDFLVQLSPDLLVVCDYGQILSPAALDTAPLGGINLHASLLPAYRGAAPINWALYHGEKRTGVTVIHMTPRLDAGPCLVQHEVAVGSDEDAIELEQRLAEVGVQPIHDAIRRLDAWDRRSPLGEIQDSQRSTKAPRLKKADGIIDWSRTAAQVFDHVRAFKPWPGTFTFCHRVSHQPLRLQVESVSRLLVAADVAPGKFVDQDAELIIACSDELLRLDRVKPEGRKSVSGADFLRGHAMQPGDGLGPAQ